jgi:hypothetical protein
MTQDQITALGITTGTWVTLENMFTVVSMIADNNLYPDPKDMQFYFTDDGSDLMFVRYTDGILMPYTDIITAGKVRVPKIINGTVKYYQVTLLPYGIDDATIGRYHDVVAYADIIGFFNK